MLVPSEVLAKRLSRAKQKIRDSGIRFEEPEARELPARVHAVLEAIYGAYGVGWDAVAGAQSPPANLCDEAIYLAELVGAFLASRNHFWDSSFLPSWPRTIASWR